MIYLGRPYSEAISVLKISDTYGLSDPRYIATLGGMLFIDKRFTDSKDVFSESSKRNFSANELYQIQFRPPDPTNIKVALRVSGKVVDVRPGYSFIECGDYPRIICRSSKYKGVLMSRGLSISFELAFTANGPVADNPIEIK